MKRQLLFILCLLFTLKVFAQEPSTAYRRSSICVMLMESSDLPNSQIIKESFLSYVIPDKFNDHNCSDRIIAFTHQDLPKKDYKEYNNFIKSSGVKQNRVGKGILKFAAEFATEVVVDAYAPETSANKSINSAVKSDNQLEKKEAVIAYNHLKNKNIAKKLFDKWFIDSIGNFSMNLVMERGLYDATIEDVAIAKNSARGIGMLADAGEELIGNTFVVVSFLKYVSKDELSSGIGSVIEGMSASVSEKYSSDIGDIATALTSTAMGAGYYIKTTSHLYKLRWNEDIANTLYSELWDNKSAYDSADIFHLDYVGEGTAWANVKESVFTNKSVDELIKLAAVNATDAVIAKLQKNYDVFKTKTPLLSIDPLLAAIGMKEGVEYKDKFEVLEQTIDSETGKTVYKRVGTVHASKQIWDNRYMASEERELTGETQDFTLTKFEGSNKKLYPGLLLRQIKK